MTTWYESKTGNHQGLVIDETTGATIAVTYDKADAPLVASAPELLAALEELFEYAEIDMRTDQDGSRWKPMVRRIYAVISKAKSVSQ